MPVDLGSPDAFADRHIGPNGEDVAEMLRVLGLASLEQLVAETVPADIRLSGELSLPGAVTEAEALAQLRALSEQNQLWKSYLGLGYSDCATHPVILRNIIENPGWYTQYTPYQAEISQGRLEALLNFQTMVADLTGLPIANASLLDEGTAVAEAMHRLAGVAPASEDSRHPTFVVSAACHPQTIEVVRTRTRPLGIDVVVTDLSAFEFASRSVFGVLAQYPATDGALGTAKEWQALAERTHAAGARLVMATDLLALTVLTPPGELGADVAVGSAQRFGVPLGYGGPHAAFFATKEEWVRKLPGRLIGVSQDVHGQVALRMALQTREQHIRREKATSNICTAQVLLAIVASMYAVWHGPRGLRKIAERVGGLTAVLALGLARLRVKIGGAHFFDTIRVDGPASEIKGWIARAEQHRINLRRLSNESVTIALDETTTADDVGELWQVFDTGNAVSFSPADLAAEAKLPWPADLARTRAYQERWKIDVERSMLSFSLRHQLLGEIGGQFRCWGGRVRIDEADPRKAAVRIWVELSSIDTGSRKRDDEILHTELFDQRSEPALEFDGERLEVDDSNRVTLVGWLCLHNFRKKISVAVDTYALEIDASGMPRFVCSARASIDRKALGLHRKRSVGHWLNDQLLGETIDIVAHIEATLENEVDASPPKTLTALRSWVGPPTACSSLA